jgi:signal transduction histidine kinase
MTTPKLFHGLESLLEITRSLSTAPELETVFTRLISTAAELTGCEAASILQVDDGGEQLSFAALPWYHREALTPLKIPVQNSAAGWAVLNNKPLLIQDASKDKRHYKETDLVANFTTRSLIAVPIAFGGETLGVMEAVNKAGGSPFTEEDLSIIETLASQAAVAMQNARLVGKLKKALAEMEELDRMKGDFIAITSHELRTPLGLILGHASYLSEGVPAEYQDQLDIIVRNAMRLKEIIDSIANMDNVERGAMSVRSQPISIKKVAADVRETFQEEADRKGVALRIEIGEDDLTVVGDATKINIALSNLVKNAITFCNQGNHVAIVAGSIPGFVKVSVIDDGIGIPLKDLPHVFERFYQVESHLTRKHGGMGLGLSVAKVMVELHGGRIWVESVEGKGSNFTFLLPVETDQPAKQGESVFIS